MSRTGLPMNHLGNRMLQIKKRLFIAGAVMAGILMVGSVAFACGPTPQKVIETVTIQAAPEKVWRILDRFDAIAQWHPDVEKSASVQKFGEDADAPHRLLTLKNGQTLEEKRRLLPSGEMKLDYQMTDGDFPVSNYRGIIQVKPGATPSEAIVTWLGRFNNQANMLDAPAGKDNATAIAAVTAFYEHGLAGLKAYAESSAN